jgi:tetratricopeptide (TPR) repeat protein
MGDPFMAKARTKLIRQRPPPHAAAAASGKVPLPLTLGLCLALAAITFAVFGQTLTHEFINFDDNRYVSDNPMVAQGLTFKGIVWAFTHFYANNWHPLTWLSHMLDCQLYGLNPGGHHLTNVLLHTATVIALFLVLRQMTGALWRSAFVAAVFAIHPLRVESVAWVAERKDVLSGFFFMLTIGAYVRYARRPWSPVRYGLVLLLFAMGLMCKPMLVTLPLALLLLDYWPLQRVEPGKLSGLVKEKLPLLALSAASCVATLLAQTEAIHSSGSFSLPLRLANALAACSVYLGQMVWPTGLAVYYPYPYNGLPPWEVALAAMLLAGLSAVAIWQRRKQPWLLMGWLWYLALLLPVVGLIQVGRQAHADRYTYLPQIGIYVAVTWMVAEWRLSRVALGGLMAGVLALLMVCTWKQTAYWQTSEILWARTLACTTDNDEAHFNLGNAFSQKGRIDDAIAQFQQALQIRPDYTEAQVDIGNILLQTGRVDEAIASYQSALQISPDSAVAHCNLGNALRQKGKEGDAMAEFQKTLQIEPGYAPAYVDIGNILLQNGQVDEAIASYQSALQISPDSAEVHYNLGNALRQKGGVDEAIAHYQNALQINPEYLDAHVNLGTALGQKGRAAEAITQFQQALQISPTDPKAQNNMAWLMATCAEASLRNGGKAVELARQVNALTGGNNPVVLQTLAAALAETGRFGDARETVHKAIELARTAGQQDLAKKLNSELQRYEAGLPWRQ